MEQLLPQGVPHMFREEMIIALYKQILEEYGVAAVKRVDQLNEELGTHAILVDHTILQEKIHIFTQFILDLHGHVFNLAVMGIERLTIHAGSIRQFTDGDPV